MLLHRYKPQKSAVLAKNQPDLLETIKKIFPEHVENEEQVGKISGLIIEYVIQSGGDVEIFRGDFTLSEEDEDEEEYDGVDDIF